MAIRKATHRETQTIVNHAPIVLTEATMGYGEPSPEKARRIVSNFLANGGYYMIYTKDNYIHGWIGVGENFDYYSNKLIGHISEVYVLPSCRGLGVAKKLCNEVFKLLEAQGYTEVQLNVFSGNNAKYLYENIGFHDISTLMYKNLKNHPNK
ncbi:GNAT family N-acetyltransferase [Paraliobacillus sediminis]|uniref:GNAT family N-acetyltransferase n=1 Tax=Paraliobacillus sediminis TaxID=1885916 RepID=UPI000E3CC390|nr:GNAT family N-acetyltransferase [Paraliobacillus sediminis]